MDVKLKHITRVESVRGDDYYATPFVATDALLSVEDFVGSIWEPCCGEGHISRRLEEFGYDVESTDLVNRGYGVSGIDCLMERIVRDNVVTNPPFKLATQMARHFQYVSSGKVALLLKLTFLEGIERKGLFMDYPPVRIWVFSKRVSLMKNGDVYSGGMMALAWFVWEAGLKQEPRVGWL
tara:strand:- start:1635 stop:2174 length:540 start_codon:yes stop_codon:yes gene_type:complete